jgi:hypothetical protein
MTGITIEYKPFGFLWRKRIEAKMPESWSEMSARQIVAIPDLNRGALDEFKLLRIFLGIKRSIAKRIDSYQRFCIIRNIKFIAKPEPIDHFIIKKILVFRAPGKYLKGITFGAFMFGDTYYQNYMQGKAEDLDRFIACFYYNRFGFKDKDIDTSARLIGIADVSMRQAIAINYGLIREWLAQLYPYVFQKAEEGQKADNSKGWVAVFDVIVGDDIVNSEKWMEKPLSEVLRYLNRKTKESYKNGRQVR